MNAIDTAPEIDASAAPTLQEQPGGRVLVTGGVPFPDNYVQAEIDAAYSRLWTFYGWLGPLAHAALAHGDDAAPRKVRAITPWGNDTAGTYSDREKHDSYLAHVRSLTSKAQPWVWPMLDAACASIVIAPEGMCFSVDTRPGVQFDLLAMKPYCALTPFADGDEVAH